MPRPSTIDRLPGQVRELIGKLRQDRGLTIDEILDHLRQLDVEVSRSALGRHVKGLAKMGERLRRSRAMAEGLARQLGDAPGDQVARVNIELLHSFIAEAFEAAEAQEDEAGQDIAAALRNPKGAALFAEAIERLTKASRHNQEFVEKIEARAAARAKQDAAKSAEAAGRERGLSAETIAAIKANILGVTPAGGAKA
jgi:hypothetical protein